MATGLVTSGSAATSSTVRSFFVLMAASDCCGDIRRERPRAGSLRAVERVLERLTDLFVDRVDDLLFEAGLERPRHVVINHRAAALVAALLEDALRRDVAGRVVAVSVHPQPQPVQL